MARTSHDDAGHLEEAFTHKAPGVPIIGAPAFMVQRHTANPVFFVRPGGLDSSQQKPSALAPARFLDDRLVVSGPTPAWFNLAADHWVPNF
jgi:hypothetical protein